MRLNNAEMEAKECEKRMEVSGMRAQRRDGEIKMEERSNTV